MEFSNPYGGVISCCLLGREWTGDIVEKTVHEFMGAFDPIFLPHFTNKNRPKNDSIMLNSFVVPQFQFHTF